MRRAIATIVLAFPLVCGGWPTSILANETLSESLTAKERIEVFETVWKTIHDEYHNYNPAFADWAAVRERYRPRVEATKNDDEFYALLNLMLLRELQDFHTSFAAPDQQPRSNGLSVNEVEGKVAVVRVESDSDAARAGVQVGMILLTRNGTPSQEVIGQLHEKLGHYANPQAEKFFLYGSFLGGPLNEPLKLGLEQADGSRLDVVLARRLGSSRPSPALISQRSPSGFHYLKILEAFRSPVDAQFKSKFADFRDAPGLIIDLRGVSGGDVHDVGLKIADYFFPTKVSFGRMVDRSGETPRFHTWNAGGGDRFYKGPVVVLIDESVRSAGEVFANGLQENGRATIIGVQSCGCVADRESKKLKGGGVLYYSHLAYLSGKGRKLEGAGVVPDKLVPLRIAALRQGRDALLEEAERTLAAASVPLSH
jgi:carboxyl-terminal processing protease